ncbi:EF-hand domain-containing protein [Stagnihabitans tardus]|uniref:EF-hand domain-containing protein n=1 Tax=Stagnihabitans tardus TaxID=2699202 RepID=A0AAE4Y826_9RHOB|nr:EF-hand domain-containing protein [Stagnihabitans tardus]NBZ87687.1 hypothetical protein [Stagnihabitans tardus]
MKMTHKTLGLSVIALAAALFATASVADNMGAGMMGADADKDGKVTQAEFEAWRTSRLVSVDADKDGKLSVDELVAARMKEAETRAKAMAERMIARQDTDKDGKLSAEELVAAPMPGFEMLDANKDGAIDQAEMQAMRGDHGPRGGKGRHGHHKGGMMGDEMPEGGN